jgi:hypothetical protein
MPTSRRYLERALRRLLAYDIGEVGGISSQRHMFAVDSGFEQRAGS